MNTVLNRIGTILVAVLLIIATGGYSVYQHYCHSEEKTLVSVFTEKLCDHDVMQEMPSCCSLPDQSPANGNQCQAESDCCHTSLTFLKISDLFTLKIDKPALDLIVVFVREMEDNVKPALISEQARPGFTSDIPPPLAAKEFLITTHQLKIAPDIA